MKNAGKLVITGAAGCLAAAALLVAQTGGAPQAQPKSAAAAPVRAAAAPAAVRVSTSAPTAADAGKSRAFLDKYCVGCHNPKAKLPAADPLVLDSSASDDMLGHAATWERVIRKLNVRAMPPAGMPRPSEAEYAAFTGWLSTSMDRAWEAHNTPGRYVVHRLNRAEYANAIRDLLAVNIDVSDLLPTDGAEYGFDNIATALKTSPLLLEGYVNAAERISSMAVGDPQVRPGIAEQSIGFEFSQSGYIDGLPLGTMGGTVMHYVFPADAEYLLSGRLTRGIIEGYSGVEGNDKPYTFIITVDGKEVFTAPIGGPKDDELQAADLNTSRAIIDKRMTGRVRVTAGPHDVGFTWQERPFKLQDTLQPLNRDSQEIHFTGGIPKLKTVRIEGPFNVRGVSQDASRKLLFVCEPASASSATAISKISTGAVNDEAACANKILSNFARRAYRRPVSATDVEAPLSFYNRSRKNGGSFDDGIRAGVARVISSPNFIYRIEKDPADAKPGVAHPVSGVELASRLSFFLWSSIPDEKLLDLGASGRLREPEVLSAQVKRMIEDDRSDALVNNFVGQWLQLRNLEAKTNPDIMLFPDFDANMRDGFRTETQDFFAYILRNNRSTLDLLNADYTFVNEQLARVYGIKGVYGPQFRMVHISDPNRRGLLGEGSILSMTSVANRTSPVFRGKYVLANLLDTPPPPPPPNVPTLADSNKGEKPKSVRAQMELHRKNQPCASCHSVIDPVGFALENFDSIGQWRDKDVVGQPLDTAGVLADGSKVNGPAALRDAIAGRPDAFSTVVASKMLTYALGRGLEPSDMPVVRQIVRKAKQNDYKLSAIVMGIIESAPFQMRTKLEPAVETKTPGKTATVAQAGNVQNKNAGN
jgi:mono/diheme cytochrome c family protein